MTTPAAEAAESPTDPDRDRPGPVPLLSAIGIVGLVLSPLLVGIEPVGWDPDLMYRPIKGVLAAALRDGRLPYWSDLFGLGVPLVAESHAAAFYPPNWVAYRFLELHAAYRLLMWVHFVACAWATYAYARALAIGGWGSALAAVAFTLGGFQAAHACHEPFYTLMPYLPLSLLLAERYLASGRAGWTAGLALCWGAQLTLGHFQIQMWTGGLVALTGIWRWLEGGCALRRASVLSTALGWGLAVASIQLMLTWEMTRVAEFDRPKALMLGYMVPPRQLAQWAFPALFQPHHLTPMHEAKNIEPYWKEGGTTPEESSSYIGTAAMLLACLGIAAIWRTGKMSDRSVGPTGTPTSDRSVGPTGTPTSDRSVGPTGTPTSDRSVGPTGIPMSDRSVGPTGTPTSDRSVGPTGIPMSDRSVGPTGTPTSDRSVGPTSSLRMWFWVSIVSAVLATMPSWWPDGYKVLVLVPTLGWFRAPGRYMVLPSLGLALLAGRGLDRSTSPGRFRLGLLLALALVGVGTAAAAWQLADPRFRTVIGPRTAPWRLAASALAWGISAWAVLAWRRGRLGPWAPLGALALELAGLFYLGPTLWGWSIPFPSSSPMMARLRQEADIGLVAGRLQNLPVELGLTVARPLLGITPPAPTSFLDPSCYWLSEGLSPVDARWQRRFGVTHGFWTATDVVQGVEVIAEGADDVLSALLETGRADGGRERWKLVRYPRPFPPAWVATRARQASGWESLYSRMAYADLPDEAWFLPDDRPPEARFDPAQDPRAMALGLGTAPEPDIDLGPRATSTEVVGWDGRDGTVEHDGSCVLIVRRAYYPGWRVRIDDGPERPASRVGYSLQGVVLTGKGPSRISMSYRPGRLGLWATVSLTATVAAFVTLGMSAWGSRRGNADAPPSP